MKGLLVAFLMLFGTTVLANEQLLISVHKHGVTGCDYPILNAVQLPDKSNWQWTVESYNTSMGNSHELNITLTHGTRNDSVYEQFTVIETKHACYINHTGQITYGTSCNNSVDFQLWRENLDSQPGTDFRFFTNRLGITLIAKELAVGNGRACVVTYPNMRKKFPKNEI